MPSDNNKTEYKGALPAAQEMAKDMYGSTVHHYDSQYLQALAQLAIAEELSVIAEAFVRFNRMLDRQQIVLKIKN